MPEATGSVEGPSKIDIDRQRSVTLTWPDGHVSRFGLEALRLACRCAACRGLEEQGLPIWPAAGSQLPLEILSAEMVGAWGMSISWNDGHSAGIYAWERLRDWCPCDECRVRS